MTPVFSIILSTGGVVVLIAIAWLLPFKIFTRCCRGLGVSAPCPFWLGWILLARPGRWRRDRTLDRIGIRRGEHVLEIGPGVGVFTVSAAERCGEAGRLLAVDIQGQMIRRVRKELARSNTDNVETLVADARRLPLEDGEFDRAFLVSALTEMRDHVAVLREVHRVLTPQGILSISEEFFDPEYATRAETIRRAQAAGFDLEETAGGLWMYTLNFRKRDPAERVAGSSGSIQTPSTSA